MKTYWGLIGFVMLAMALLQSVKGAEIYWKGTAGGTYGTAANWVGGVVPGATDMAHFTNLNNSVTITWAAGATNDSARFSQNSIVTNAVAMSVNAGCTYLVTNAIDIGYSGAGGHSFQLQGAGSVVVTNAAGTAQFNYRIPPGVGNLYPINGGNLVADHYYMITSAPWGVAGTAYFGNGTLTTKGDSEFSASPTGVRFGEYTAFTWNILGGTNLVTGKGLLFGAGNFAGHRLTVDGSNTQLRVSGAGLTSKYGARVIVTNGASVVTVGGQNLYCNSGGQLILTGAGSRADIGWQVYFQGNDNRIYVQNGGVLTMVGGQGSYMPQGASATNNWLFIDGAGSRFVAGSMEIGRQNAAECRVLVSNGGELLLVNNNWLYLGNSGGGTGSVQLTSGGLLDCYNVSLSARGSITNQGGVFQMGVASPTVSLATPGSFVFTNGTISFRAITDANVYGINSGTQLTNITFLGNNAFRLNNASNTASGQAYVFDTGRGVTNYTRLELVNSSAYRGGAVTIGGGGTLVVSNGTSTISSNLTLQSGSVFAVHVTTNAATSGSLTVGGTTIALGGATLQVTLGSIPTESQLCTILANPGTAPVAGLGTFSASSVNADYQGKTYTLIVRYGAGDGNDVAVSLATKGSLVLIR